ncbi:hypothetical protein BKA69DRAFT_52944 [Paraphysoderma sedebokerense]|nr:hypothetical protein BKA69DRAFT_52944 [Paraphysoderma sedebokerense]
MTLPKSGLPAPSAAIGKFDPFLSLLLSPAQLSNSYRDLYVQKLSLVSTYFKTAGFQISEITWLQDMEQAYNAVLSDEEYALRTVQLIESFYAKRTALGSQQMLRNILTLFALSAFWIVLTLLIVHKYTYCDLWVILRRPKQIDDRDKRLYLFKCLTPLPRSAPYSTIVRRWFFTHKREIQDSLFLYLMRHYNVLFTSIAMMVLIVMSGFYTYLVPIFWNVNYIEPETWSLRFRLLTVQFMSFPLFFGNLYLLWSQPKYHFTNSIYDDIYKCEIAKEKRRLAVVTDESEKAKGLRDLFEEELLFESVKFDKETKILADLVKVD